MDKKVCFSGHRSQKLPWGLNEREQQCLALKMKMKNEIEKAIQEGYHYFISGMALGCDIYFAEIILSLQKYYANIRLECAIPYVEQPSRWRQDQKKRYSRILESSFRKTFLSPNYYHGCLLKRNEYMVNQSSLLIAVYNEGEKGGTNYTIHYAKERKKEIRVIPIEKGENCDHNNKNG